jgi:predicted acyltransferase
MLLVNNAGAASAAYPQLSHAAWEGLTVADVVFPLFLFAVGAAMAIRRGEGGVVLVPWPRLLRRVVLLSAAGLALNLLRSGGDLTTVRIMGVLQLIALASVVAALLLRLPRRWQIGATIGALVAWWAALAWIPVPGHGVPSLTPEANLPGAVDAAVLGGEHLYQGLPYDPEGLVAIIPAAIIVVAGAWAAGWVTRAPRLAVSGLLASAGVVVLLAGWALNHTQPTIKSLWTAPYVMQTIGWSLAVFAAIALLTEVLRQRRFGWPFAVLGRNAILVYVGSEVFRTGPWRTAEGELIPRVLAQSLADGPLGSLTYPLAVVGVWLVVAAVLHWRRWYLRV